ncbi:uncharacterized protein BO95DRAFT_456648 [Aspergillus brunneoviolaceus CBS 621.78]|uniref:Uncharacterized protein n=1 Tax=Aspergillus brunneoviolaceus CBS 621.78 TaxID=1450534 RepID=A0ACD1FWL0_9EURO|nr:hypothetical protein BO95DRAFT_456648 [Aspergillus brunneoviolaceus CBS 621.78]RAH41359.1 hypothetical protein BO95DRAFT_456648 [Aspergillus brunneoviolaceus CBS 621.78]
MVLSRSLLAAASAFLLGSPTEAAGAVTELQSVLKNTHMSNEYGYPTDFTRGVMPIPVHSHNDYWRDIPFYSGLSQGCISTEADVWLYNGTLYVGHDESSLTEKRTLESLYINPILDVLQRQNPTSRFVTSPTKNGVFDTDTSQTLYFFIDLKTSGPETLDAVIKALEPLRARGYLTTLKDNTTITEGPVTVIGTGNTPLDLVGPVANRDYFFDAPLDQLGEGQFADVTGLISPIASTNFVAAVGPLSHGDLLAEVLPAGVKITIRHVSSTPTPCPALFAAPPGETSEPTFCENHFLTASVDAEGKDGAEIIVLGVEVLIYSTAHLTTIFVSKADSTGFLHLLQNAPKVSLLRRISQTFLSFLVRTHQRPGVRLVVSLFARAQNQYLFPGSIENAGKHVLDDRGLIKWWCRVFDPILREYEPESGSHEKNALDRQTESAQSSATAFLIVPGCDKFETRGFFPSAARLDSQERPRWRNSYPLHQLCDDPKAPPRCLVPRFPDDPKTRFLIDLDDELPPQSGDNGKSSSVAPGQWRSVKSLDQFWEMMSFRQECSSGRLVGFLWLVINPPGLVNSVQMTSSRSVLGDLPELQSNDSKSDSLEQPEASEGPSVAQPVDAAAPQPTAESLSVSESTAQRTTAASAFFWPEAGRGHAVLSEADYKAAIDFLIEQDFFNQEVSIASTRAWGQKIASLADQLWVGQQVLGRGSTDNPSQQTTEVNTLISSTLVRKRKKVGDEPAKTEGIEKTAEEPATDANAPPADATASTPTPESTSGVNVLQANLIRKKKKT